MQWFIIKKNEHFGPYTKNDLFKMYASQQIFDDTELWQDGEKESMFFSVLKDKEDHKREILANEPPEIPIELTESKKNPVVAKLEEPKIKTVLLADISDDKDEEAFIQTSQREMQEVDGPRFLSKLRVISFVSMILVTLIVIGIYDKSTNAVFSRPANMSLADFKRLKKTARIKNNELQFDFAISKDKNILWVGTNNKLEGAVHIHLSSLEGKHLGDDTNIQAIGYLKNKLITVNEFQFSKGTRLVDGIYKINIFTTDALSIPFFQKILTSKYLRFNTKMTTLISGLNKQDFFKQLERLNKNKKNNDFEFWNELKQKYKTIRSMSLNIKDSLADAFDASDKSLDEKVVQFESDYKTKYGIFFTNFVIANEKSYSKLSKKDFPNKFEIISNYSKLSKLAKRIGAISMETLHELQSLDIEKVKLLEELKLKQLSQFDIIIKECDLKLSKFKSR